MTTGIVAPLVPANVRVPPLFIWTPPRAATAADKVARLMELYGRPPDGEQRLALDCLTSMRPDGRWASFTSAIMESRQNGKTASVLLPSAMAELFLFGRKLVLWTAHLQATADKTATDLLELIESTPALSRRLKNHTSAGGNHAFHVVGGGLFQILARSPKAGRGFTKVDLIVLDEAQEVKQAHLGALLPTMATSPNPHLMLAGSAGGLNAAVWRDVRNRGRAGALDPAKGDPTLAYIEWGARRVPCKRGPDCQHRRGTPGCQLDNPERRQEANHTMRSVLVPDGRTAPETIDAFRQSMDPTEFAREILGWWEDPETLSPVEDEAWSALKVREHPIPVVPARAPKMFLVDVAPGSRSAAIVLAAKMPNGRTRLEVVDHRPGDDWVVAECARLKKQHRARIVLVKAAPSAVLIGDLVTAGVDPYLMNEAEYTAACGMFLKQANPLAPKIEHLGDPILTEALEGAVMKDTGDGMQKWARAKSADICALVAASLGPWALANVPGPSNFFVARG